MGAGGLYQRLFTLQAAGYSTVTNQLSPVASGETAELR